MDPGHNWSWRYRAVDVSVVVRGPLELRSEVQRAVSGSSSYASSSRLSLSSTLCSSPSISSSSSTSQLTCVSTSSPSCSSILSTPSCVTSACIPSSSSVCSSSCVAISSTLCFSTSSSSSSPLSSSCVTHPRTSSSLSTPSVLSSSPSTSHSSCLNYNFEEILDELCGLTPPPTPNNQPPVHSSILPLTPPSSHVPPTFSPHYDFEAILDELCGFIPPPSLSPPSRLPFNAVSSPSVSPRTSHRTLDAGFGLTPPPSVS